MSFNTEWPPAVTVNGDLYVLREQRLLRTDGKLVAMAGLDRAVHNVDCDFQRLGLRRAYLYFFCTGFSIDPFYLGLGSPRIPEDSDAYIPLDDAAEQCARFNFRTGDWERYYGGAVYERLL